MFLNESRLTLNNDIMGFWVSSHCWNWGDCNGGTAGVSSSMWEQERLKFQYQCCVDTSCGVWRYRISSGVSPGSSYLGIINQAISHSDYASESVISSCSWGAFTSNDNDRNWQIWNNLLKTPVKMTPWRHNIHHGSMAELLWNKGQVYRMFILILRLLYDLTVIKLSVAWELFLSV